MHGSNFFSAELNHNILFLRIVRTIEEATNRVKLYISLIDSLSTHFPLGPLGS
jgi:hypothetical protein